VDDIIYASLGVANLVFGWFIFRIAKFISTVARSEEKEDSKWTVGRFAVYHRITILNRERK
jgi:hypothetical protein